MSTDSQRNSLEDDPARAADERLAKIKKLKAKLINEEHRLVLMKKIRQSQTRPISQQQPNQLQQPHAGPSQHHPNLNNLGTPSSSSISNLMNNINSHQSPNPAKKLRPNSMSGMSYNQSVLNATNLAQLGGHNLVQQGKNLLLSNSASNLAQQVNSAASAAALNQTPAHAHQRPKNNNLWNQPIQQARQPTPAGIAPPHVGNLNRPPITTPPNVVQAMMGGLNASQQSILMNQILSAGAAAAASTPQTNKRSSLGNLARQQAMTTPPNVVQDGRLGQQSLSSTPQLSGRRAHVNMSRQPLTTPPSILHDNRSSLSGQQSLLMNASNLSATTPSGGGRSQRSGTGAQQSLTPQQQSSSPFNKSQAAQILLQKRQAAKSAIQKQLEQTLMQLPDKRIQLGIDFIPNANNLEFVYYIGLEACVDYLTNSENPLDTQPLEKPFECSTCGTDFTPSWSWKRSMPVCENCVSVHVKKSIKNSQTNRIKSVLSKTAKQEHEMDQRIMAEAASVVSSSPSTTPSTTSTNQRHPSLLQPASHQTPRSTPQAAPWPRVNPSPLATVNRSSNATSSATTSPATNILANLNLSNPLAALGNLPATALASLLQMNPQISSLASLMTANAAPTSTANNNNNQIAQVAALLMNQLSKNMWNNR